MTEYKYRIQDLAEDERPRERLIKFGPQALSSAELLAILLRVGVKGENAVRMSERILHELGGLIGLHKADIGEVSSLHGMGTAKAATLKAAIELGRRLSIETPDEKPTIRAPEDVARLLQFEMRALDQENLKVLLLTTKNQVMAAETVYKGSISSAQVRIAELFKTAVRRNAASIILVQNHPRGDPSPSREDILLTKQVKEAGDLMNIQVLDHIVIGDGNFVSLKEAGYIR